MSIELPFHDGIDETESAVRLSPEAMNLAHDIALHEADLRAKGRSAERIKYLRGKDFGSKIAKLSIRDQTAPSIYYPVLDEQTAPDRRTRSVDPTPLADWARSTYVQNIDANGVGGVRDLAFKD